MSLSVFTHICFVCCHPGPAAPFADFSKVFEENERMSYSLATESAHKILSEKGVHVDNFYTSRNSAPLSSLADEDAEILALTVAKTSSGARHVMLDVGSPFAAQVLKALSEKHPEVIRIAYYDNPQGFVGGGYSETVAKIIPFAEVVLFGNSRLAKEGIYKAPGIKIDLSGKTLIGLGYSALPSEVEAIKTARKERDRAACLKLHGIEDKGQKIAVYFG